MFQKTKQLCRKAFGFVNGIPTKVMMFSFMLLSGMVAKAQNSAGDYSAGTSALSTVAEEIAKYVPIMVKLCYAIAGSPLTGINGCGCVYPDGTTERIVYGKFSNVWRTFVQINQRYTEVKQIAEAYSLQDVYDKLK